MPSQKDLVEFAEYHLEDVYDGILALDRLLKLVKWNDTLPITQGQVISTAFYVTGRVAQDLDDLASVSDDLSEELQSLLVQYTQRFSKQQRQIHRYKSGLA